MFAITNATIITMQGPVMTEATVIVDGGKIIGLGVGIPIPEGCNVIDASGKFVTPGLIDAHTHLGVYQEAQGWAGEDGNEMSGPITPGMDVLDAINPVDIGLAEALAGGVTTVMVAPGSANPIGGQCTVIKTRRKATVDEMVIRRHAGLKIAFGENPKRVYGEQKKAPFTRMATAALIRETLHKGKDYVAKQGEKDWKYDLGLEAIGRVLKGEMPIRAHAHRADDIVTALRIADEFGLDIIIEHATEGHLIADYLASRKARLVIGPTMITRSKREVKERTFAAAGKLAKAGVKFAIMSDHPVVPCAFLPVYAGLSVRFGLAEEQALRALTINAAEILGVADRVGSIAPGKDADLVIWGGHPLSVTARPELVVIDGKIGEVDDEQKIREWRN